MKKRIIILGTHDYTLGSRLAEIVAKFRLSDVSLPEGTFCDLYKKECMGSLCSVTPTPEKCEHAREQNAS